MKTSDLLNLLPNISNANSDNFFLLAGPCVIESEQLIMDVAGTCKEICAKYNIPYVFKASYRKANRSSVSSFCGIGDQLGLELLQKVGNTLGVPTVTDVHSADEATIAAEYVDILQIPAFLCRQTDILLAAAATGKVVNVKKGQFLSPEAMQFVFEKLDKAGAKGIMLTERGTTFGYQDLVVDFRGIPTMKNNGCPVVMDVTHSLQQPNQMAGVTGGRPDLIETIARAAIAVGADGLFIETHPDPKKALSDGANMLKLNELDALMQKLSMLRQTVNKF
ncbi:MAG: 3-deoxy-8-phosphooctulonate synthase [Rikenellaceae bacterium]